MSRTAVAALACAGLLLSACASVNHRADIAVVGLRVEDVSVLAARMIFTVRVDNEEPVPLVLDGSAHELRIAGHRVGKGLLNERVEIPRLSSVRLEVPLEISTTALIGPIREAIESGSFSYQVRSTLYVLQGDRSRALDVSKQGTVDLSVISEPSLARP